MRNKLFLLAVVISFGSFCNANANLALQDITAPKAPAYRVGISDIPENPYIQNKDDKNSIEKVVKKQLESFGNNDINSYAELSIKRLSQEIAYDIECDEQQMISDLSLLWQGAAMQSDTINFALYKLANPDADKPDKSTVKNMLKTVASMSTLVGAGISNPLLAGTSLIGANVLGIMSQDTKALNYKYSKVTDADMIILIRKVEDLQQKTVDLYYDYMNAKKQLDIITKLAQERKSRFELAQKNNVSREIIVITDSYFRTAVDRQKTARSEFLSKRAALEQFVGNEAFSQFEQELAQRENYENGNEKATKEHYEQTVSGVENYTRNLNNRTASLSGIGYIEEEDDKNLSKLSPIEEYTPQANDNQTEENNDVKVQEIQEEAQESVKIKNKKSKKEKKVKNKVKKEKTQKVKRVPYDTKGFIFLHDKQPNLENYTDNEVAQPIEEQKVNNKSSKVKKAKKTKELTSQSEKNENKDVQVPKAQPEPQKFHGVDLLPLEEIKAPDLKPNGYSIFAR